MRVFKPIKHSNFFRTYVAKIENCCKIEKVTNPALFNCRVLEKLKYLDPNGTRSVCKVSTYLVKNFSIFSDSTATHITDTNSNELEKPYDKLPF